MSRPLVPIEQAATLKHLLEDSDYWLDKEPTTRAQRKLAPSLLHPSYH